MMFSLVVYILITLFKGLIHDQDIYAVKTIVLPGEWWAPWRSSDSATWVEASRLALCASAAQHFLRLVADTEMVIYRMLITL